MELSLDLGQHLGYCIRYDNGEYEWGMEKLGEGDQKFVDFSRFLRNLSLGGRLKKVYYEEVNFSGETYSTQSWGGMKAIMVAFCIDNHIEYKGFDVRTVKKKLTGRGNASKMGMIHYAEQWIGEEISDDNTADAIGVMYTGRNGVK